MKHTLKICAVLLACSSYVVLVAAIPAKADVQNEIPYLWSEFASDDITSVEDVVTPRARGDILNRGYVRLTNTDWNYIWKNIMDRCLQVMIAGIILNTIPIIIQKPL